MSGEILCRPLRESWLVIRKLADPWPAFFVWSPKNSVMRGEVRSWRSWGIAHAPEDLEDLVNLRIPREQRMSSHNHLRKDAPHGPHVDTGRVVTCAQENFGSAVPQGDNLDKIRTMVSGVQTLVE